MNENKSKISNVEWGLVIGTLLFIDLSQVLLEWIVIGLILNPLIDIFVGMSFALYLQVRGEKMNDPKRAGGLILTFLLELVPGVDELPLWCLDGLYAMFLSKRKVILNAVTSNIPGQSKPNQPQNNNAENGSQNSA